MTRRKSNPFQTRQELAERFRVRPSTIIAWDNDPEFPKPYKFGGNVRYVRTEIDEWAESCRQS